MLEELANKDNYWRKIAFNICKDRYLADDLVNEMYLKLYDCKKQINDFFVIIVIRNIFLDLKRKKGTLHLDDFYNLESDTNEFEVDDIDKIILDAYNELSFSERELILLANEMSLRDIEKEFNINYGFVYRKVKFAKEKIKDKTNGRSK
jgi:RNA polymerase sigma factor (sigma-70 family)